MAKLTPVEPTVPSVSRPPGAVRVPSARASWIIARATRSLTLPPGLRNSALARMSHPVASDNEGIRMRGVLPMREGRPVPTVGGRGWCLDDGGSGCGGNDVYWFLRNSCLKSCAEMNE